MKTLRLIAVACLMLNGVILKAAPPADAPLREKTIVVWTTVANLQQRNASVLTMENAPSEFDGLIFGEIQPSKWMVGSDYFKRTQREQDAYVSETAGPDDVLQLAIVYREKQITLYRNGEKYASYAPTNPLVPFTRGSRVMLGLHHFDAFGSPGFAGTVDDARIYNRALTQDEIRSLRPNLESPIQPWAWWTFDDATDRAGAFPPGQTVGQAASNRPRPRAVALACPPKGGGWVWKAPPGLLCDVKGYSNN